MSRVGEWIRAGNFRPARSAPSSVVGAEESRRSSLSVLRSIFPALTLPNSPHGQAHPPEPWLRKRWKVVRCAIDGFRYDIPFAVKPTPHVSVWCICVEVQNVVRVHVRFYDAGAMGEDPVR